MSPLLKAKVVNYNDILLRNAAYVIYLGNLLYFIFPFRPIVWRIGLVLLSLTGLLLFSAHYRFTSLGKSILAFITINAIYFLVSFLWQTPEFTNFGNILCSMLPIFLFYYLTAKRAITEKSIIVFIILVAVGGFLYFRHAEYMILIASLNGEEGEITVNASIIFLVMIPLLFFVKNKFLVFALVLEIIFFIVLGAKRGNILAAIIPLLLLYVKNFKTRGSIFTKILVIVSVIVLSLFAFHLATNNDYIMTRYEETLEGNSSGRDNIYANAWKVWYESESDINLFLGHGTDSTINLLGIRAHNDWLELLVNMGLLGIAIYLIFFLSLLRSLYKNWGQKEIWFVLLAIIALWFAKSLYSMGFTENFFSFISMALGIALGKTSVNNRISKIRLLTLKRKMHLNNCVSDHPQ